MSLQKNTDLWRKFEYCANQIVPGFVVDESNAKIIEMLCQYLDADPAFEAGAYYLGRGLFLSGTVGSGKTDLMRIVQRFFWNANDKQRQFAQVSMIDYSRQYGKKDSDGNMIDLLDRYRNRHIFFDEFGMIDENTKKRKYEQIISWGSHKDLGEEVVLSRYNEFKKGFLTHFTTNLKLSELENQYDSRTVSRLREMCNVIPVVGPDRRMTAKPRLQVEPPKPEEPGNIMKLLPIIQQYHPDQAKQLMNTIENVVGRHSPDPQVKPQPKPAATYESWLSKFKEGLPETETEELARLLKDAEMKQSYEISRIIQTELTKRNKAA